MFHMTRPVWRVRVPVTATRTLSSQTPLRAPFQTPYLPYLLCVAHRLDLLTARRMHDGRVPTMPPLG